MLIRRLVPSDASAFLALRLAALLDCPTAFSSSYEEERSTSLATIEARLGPQSGRCMFGAFEEDALAGMLGLGREDGHKVHHKGFLRGIYTVPAQRGKGAARKMLQQALEAARAMEGLQQITLTVTSSNEAALALYKSLGFSAYGRAPRALLVDGVFHDDVHMVLEFG